MRIKAKGFPFTPKISPAIQGQKAYDLLSTRQKGLLEFALQNTARRKKCSVNDLEWEIGKGYPGCPIPIRVQKKQRIEL